MACDLAGRGEVDVADELALGGAVDADVDDQRPRLDPVAADEAGLADAGNDDVGLANEAGQVARRRMADGDGTACHQQLERHRAADDVRLADDHRVLADEVLAGVAQQRHAAVRRAGAQRRAFQHQAPDVVGVEAVDVLHRQDRLGHRFLVDVPGQRQLDQDAVDGGVGIEPRDQVEQLDLRRRRRQVVGERAHAHRLGRPPLVADVDLRRRVLAHQHDGEPGSRATGGEPGSDGGRNLLGDARGARLAVDDAGTHERAFRRKCVRRTGRSASRDDGRARRARDRH